MYCQNCGKKVSDIDRYCQSCGNSLQRPVQPTSHLIIDETSAIEIVLSFVFPFVGLVLFLIWQEKKPKSARTIGIAALIGFIIDIILIIGMIQLV